MMEGWGRDLAFASRALRRRPGFTAVAVLTLAVGIGANTAIFSVVNGVLLRPLPYEGADRIGILWHELGDGAQNLPAVHALDARDYRERSELLEAVTIATGREWILGAGDDTEIVDVGVVEVGFFELFGVAPALGRSFRPEEDAPGAAPTAVLSHRLWARRYGGDPSIVGRSIELDGASMRVVGVLPASFTLHLPPEAFLLRDAELWTTLRLDPARQPPRNYTAYTSFVRLRPGVTFDEAQSELEALAAVLRTEHPVHAASNLQARVVPLLHDVVKGAEATLQLLLGAVGFVLLIACANVANLVAVRGQSRAHELSLRAALGAGRAGLVRLVMMESLALSGAGAALGALLAMGGLGAIEAAAAGTVPRLDSVGVDGAVLGFVAAVAMVSAVLVGLLPALESAGRDPAQALSPDARATGGRRRTRFRDALVVGEVAASLVLLVGTGLMVRGFIALGSARPGYEIENTLTFRVSLPEAAFPEDEARIAFRDELFEVLSGLPGVLQVAGISQLPLTGSGPLAPYAYDEETATNWESVTGDIRFVTPGFFAAVGARLEGSEFHRTDGESGNRLIVDDRLAGRAFPEGDAVGQLLQVNPDDAPEEIRYARIIGVVDHLRLHDLGRPHLTQLYFLMQGAPRFSAVMRTSGDPAGLVPAVRAAVARLAPGAPVEDVRTMSDLASASLAPTRLTLGLMSAFGVVALLLASIGLYGVLSYAVTQRTREIGVRMALGQDPARVRRLVMLEGGRLVAFATVLGLAAAALLSRAATGVIYGVEPLDPLTYVSTSLVLAGASAVACWVPALRATRVDPATALRE